MILSGAWYFRFRTTHLSALEPLDLRGEACMRLHKLDAKLVETKSLQGLRLLHVSANFVEPVRNAVSSGTRREIGSAVIGVRRGLGRECLTLSGHSSTTSTLIVGVKVDMSCAGSLPYSHGLLAGLVIASYLSLERITAAEKQSKIK